MSTIATEPLSLTDSELLTVVAARELAGRGMVFAGHGLPTLAVSLAQHTVAPGCEVIYECGVTGAHPESLPLSISDSVLVSGAECVLPMTGLFQWVLQGGRVEVGFLGAAQIDRHGSLNSTLIGKDWRKPEVKLPGSGGAVEIMANAREVFVIMRRHTPQTFVEQLDFVTSPSPHVARDHGIAPPSGAGVSRVITPYGVLSRQDGELVLTDVHPGISIEQVRTQTGWDLRVSDEVTETPPPSEVELTTLRERLDPARIYLR